MEEFAEKAYGTKEAGVPSSYGGKALTIWDYENRMMVCDLLGACGWVFMNWTGGGADTSSLEVPVKLYSLATGRDASERARATLYAARAPQNIKTNPKTNPPLKQPALGRLDSAPRGSQARR